MRGWARAAPHKKAGRGFLRLLKAGLAPLARANKEEATMPQIIVTANQPVDGNDQPVMLRERVSAEDFKSDHFQAQLIERLGWAVGDAVEVERGPGRS
jgi:hypothetical protein